ncbi:MAG: CDP-diacylglycerol--serine O-phosphatidyltransferase [Proteobacteria bacterium]|nr:CDP-diacylglycerol--serine O-phosphatidyltransferase [Pseudomonadota bacterium]
MKKKKNQVNKLRRGIYILPNLFTSMNIFCGFYSIIASIQHNYEAAAVSILIAVVFDSLDGKIARATNTTSRFGVEYDSLADLISFGLAPALMIYLWMLQGFGKTGWLAGFLYTICGALRLARFNTLTGVISSEYFQGLPIPAGAGMCASTVLFITKYDFSFLYQPVMILIMLYILAFLMVSSIKYNSFKKAELFTRIRFSVLVIIILTFVFIAERMQAAFFALAVVYVISGPITYIVWHKQNKNMEVEIEIEDH